MRLADSPVVAHCFSFRGWYRLAVLLRSLPHSGSWEVTCGHHRLACGSCWLGYPGWHLPRSSPFLPVPFGSGFMRLLSTSVGLGHTQPRYPVFLLPPCWSGPLPTCCCFRNEEWFCSGHCPVSLRCL